MITTVAGTGEPGRGPDAVAADTSALNFPSALAVDGNNDLYIVDWQNYLDPQGDVRRGAGHRQRRRA